MNRYLVALAIFAAAMSPSLSAADATQKDVRHEEQASNSTGVGQYLKTLLSKGSEKPAAKKPVEVDFSRSWIDAQPKAHGDENWRCLSEALYFEARGETVKGQFAVAEVIKNRVQSSRFPGSFCAVINQGTGRKFQCQFTYTCDGRKEVIAEPKAYERVAKVARAVIDGAVPDMTDGATHYHTKSVLPSWARVYTRTAKIGVHFFYRPNYRTASNG
ncbi:MAG: cell wall hydrolase [Planctomycetes bacterium]|nr:cell wall hydrolase [Planctomycetota bacterium]